MENKLERKWNVEGGTTKRSTAYRSKTTVTLGLNSNWEHSHLDDRSDSSTTVTQISIGSWFLWKGLRGRFFRRDRVADWRVQRDFILKSRFSIGQQLCSNEKTAHLIFGIPSCVVHQKTCSSQWSLRLRKCATYVIRASKRNTSSTLATDSVATLARLPFPSHLFLSPDPPPSDFRESFQAPKCQPLPPFR